MADIINMEYKGFTLQVRSDEIYMTVYDAYGEPCATVTRPSFHNKDGWTAHGQMGNQLIKHAVGPRQCLRSVAIYNGAV